MKYLALAAVALGLMFSGNARSDARTEMQPVSFSQWEKILEEQQGSITVVDAWASWCSPCIERFPHMVDLYHQYNSRGVHFISLNFDEQGDIESLQWANQFLQRVEAVFSNYHMNENMTEAFDRLGLVGLPAVLIYDADGNQAYRLTGDDPNNQFDDQDVENAVLTLLGQALIR